MRQLTPIDGGVPLARVKSSEVVTSITNWMSRTIKTGASITAHHVEAWRDALTVAQASIEAREEAIKAAQAQLSQIAGRDRLTAVDTEESLRHILLALQVLGRRALDAADAGDHKTIVYNIEVAADAAENLTLGVARPEFIQNIKKGL